MYDACASAAWNSEVAAAALTSAAVIAVPTWMASRSRARPTPGSNDSSAAETSAQGIPAVPNSAA